MNNTAGFAKRSLVFNLLTCHIVSRELSCHADIQLQASWVEDFKLCLKLAPQGSAFLLVGFDSFCVAGLRSLLSAVKSLLVGFWVAADELPRPKRFDACMFKFCSTTKGRGTPIRHLLPILFAVLEIEPSNWDQTFFSIVILPYF